jgi:hypothetical protein
MNNSKGMVSYREVVIVSWNEESIVLDTGGFFTKTTKKRMNQASNMFRLGFYVYQKNFDWFVDFKGITRRFVRNIVVIER